MPTVGNKKFQYTPKGFTAAMKESKKTGKKFDVNVSFKKEAASAKEFLQPPDLVVASGEEEC